MTSRWHRAQTLYHMANRETAIWGTVNSTPALPSKSEPPGTKKPSLTKNDHKECTPFPHPADCMKSGHWDTRNARSGRLWTGPPPDRPWSVWSQYCCKQNSRKPKFRVFDFFMTCRCLPRYFAVHRLTTRQRFSVYPVQVAFNESRLLYPGLVGCV